MYSASGVVRSVLAVPVLAAAVMLGAAGTVQADDPVTVAAGDDAGARGEGCPRSPGVATSPGFAADTASGPPRPQVRCDGREPADPVTDRVTRPGGTTAPGGRADGGDTATHATAERGGARESGPGAPQAVVGLVLAAVAAVAVAVRGVRRRRRDTPDGD